MAQENSVDINIKVGGNQDQALGSLKKQLKEAIQEVQVLTEKFGETSEQTVRAVERAAALKDQIGFVNDSIEAFNPDAKFKSLTASLSGVAGGFAAAQGAIGLFGVESKEVEQALLRVQSAMALSQGLQAVGESIDSFKQLGTVIKNSTIFIKANEMANKAASFAMRLFGVSVETTSTSFKVLKGVIAATGLGLLVVALGEVVSMFQNFSSAAEKAAEKQDEFNKRVTEGAKTALKAEQQNLANQEKLEIAKAKLRGASEKEIFDIEQSYRRLKAQAQVRFFEETKNADKQAAKEAKEEIDRANVEGQVALLDFQAKQAAARKAKAKEANDALAEQEAARLEKQLNDEKKLTEQLLEEYDKRRGIANNAKILTQKELNALDAQDEAEKAAKQKEKEDKQIAFLSKITNYTYQNILKDQQLKEDARKAELQADQALQDAKFQAASAGLNLLASLAGENEKIANAIFVIDKALAIAKIVVDTQREISAYAANPTWSLLPDGGALIKGKYILAAKVRAGAGIASIVGTTIAKFKGGGSAGGVGGGTSAPSVSAGAPLAPPQPQAQTTTLDSQSINAIGNQATRAYVLESDVTGSQQRIAAIQQRARFG
jgi:hypothetical protein